MIINACKNVADENVITRFLAGRVDRNGTEMCVRLRNFAEPEFAVALWGGAPYEQKLLGYALFKLYSEQGPFGVYLLHEISTGTEPVGTDGQLTPQVSLGNNPMLFPAFNCHESRLDEFLLTKSLTTS